MKYEGVEFEDKLRANYESLSKDLTEDATVQNEVDMKWDDLMRIYESTNDQKISEAPRLIICLLVAVMSGAFITMWCLGKSKRKQSSVMFEYSPLLMGNES